MGNGAVSVTGTAEVDYWDRLLAHDLGTLAEQAEWLRYSRGLYAEWITRYLETHGTTASVLKTDAFEETRGTEVIDALRSRFGRVVTIDVAHSALRRAGLGPQRKVQSSVLQLPFRPAAFDAVVSLSTLDHLASAEEIVAALRGLSAVTRPGGQMLLTLDNLANPVVWLRNAVPHAILNSVAKRPYRYGATLTPHALEKALRMAGWKVRTLTSVVHPPRVLAVAMSKFVGEGRPLSRSVYDRCLRAFESWAALPTRHLTGYFTLTVCERLGEDEAQQEPAKDQTNGPAHALLQEAGLAAD